MRGGQLKREVGVKGLGGGRKERGRWERRMWEKKISGVLELVKR